MPGRKAWYLLVTLVGLLGAWPASAQNYPERQINWIVPFGAGGGSDIIARTVAEELSKALGQAIVVEARPGANGSIGSAAVAKANPDGYLLLSTATSTFALNPNLMKDLPYDQLRDFAAVAPYARGLWMLIVNTKSGVKTMADFVKLAKDKQGQLNFGFWTSNVLVTGVAVGKAAGFEFKRVPYKGAVEATTDLVAGRIDFLFMDVNGAKAFMDSGDLRAIAVTTANRVKIYPELPTMTELGYPVVSDAVIGLFAPIKTPRPIIDKLNAEITKVVSTSKSVRDRLASLGLEPLTMTPQEMDAFVRSEIDRWGLMVKQAGLEKE